MNLANTSIMDMVNKNHGEIKEGLFRASKEVASGGKTIRAIYKQHHVREVAFAGHMYFNADGKEVHEGFNSDEYFKYKIVYLSLETNEEFVWCFN